jgi:integrase/recombinase XerC
MELQHFLDYIQFEKRFSPHTCRAYENDLKQFFGYLLDSFDTEEIPRVDYHMIRSWIVSLMNNGATAKSINRKISTLKTFYRFLLTEGVITSNPLSKIVAPKIPKNLPVFIEKNKISRLTDTTIFDDNFTGKRDRAIIELFYATGIRVSELVSLKISSIDYNNYTIKVIGKRNKERIIPFAPYLKHIIEIYLDEREGISGSDKSDFLFLTSKGRVMYPRLVYIIVKKYLSLISTVDKKSPHILRHTFATHMLNAGADINAIKELLGHASLSATQVYTHNTIEQLKTIYSNAHPRAKFKKGG